MVHLTSVTCFMLRCGTGGRHSPSGEAILALHQYNRRHPPPPLPPLLLYQRLFHEKNHQKMTLSAPVTPSQPIRMLD